MKQTTVVICTSQILYIALSQTSLMVLYLRHVIKTIHKEQKNATVVFVANEGVKAINQSSKLNLRTQHIDIEFHHVRFLVAESIASIECIGGCFQRINRELRMFKLFSNRLVCSEN